MRETKWSVEIKANSYDDDYFNGSFEECVEFCKDLDYTIGEDCQIAKILIEDGVVIETLDVVTEVD